jgi:hypothetical protein
MRRSQTHVLSGAGPEGRDGMWRALELAPGVACTTEKCKDVHRTWSLA